MVRECDCCGRGWVREGGIWEPVWRPETWRERWSRRWWQRKKRWAEEVPIDEWKAIR